MKNKWIIFLSPTILGIVALCMLIAGMRADPTAWTDDHTMHLDKFYYMMAASFFLFPSLVAFIIYMVYKRGTDNVKYLQQQGIPGSARLLETQTTNLRINGIPQLALKLDITTQMGQHFEATVKKCVLPNYYAILRPDLAIPVLVDPKNEKNIYLDLDSLWLQEVNKAAHTPIQS